MVCADSERTRQARSEKHVRELVAAYYIIIEVEGREKYRKVNRSASQALVLGPTLWGSCVSLQDGFTLIAFAVDVAMIV